MAFSKVKVGGLADDSVTAANIDDDGTGYTVGNLTNSGTLQQTGQATFGSGGTNWTLPTARGTDKYVLQINGSSGAATWVESLVAPEISGHDFDVSGSTDDGGINQYEEPYALTATLTNASTTVSAITTTNIKVGQYISGAGIPADTTVSSISSAGSSNNGTIVISNQATAAGTGVAVKVQKTPGEKNGGKVTLTGANFGATIGEVTVSLTDSSGAVIANASYLSGLSGGNTITAEWTGTEGDYATKLKPGHSDYIGDSGLIYFKMTKSGLASNVHNTNATLTSDPAVTTLSGSSQTGGDVSTDPNATSLGAYGTGRTAGGGQDSNTSLLLNFDKPGGKDIEDSSNIGGNGYKVPATGGCGISASPFGDGKSAFRFPATNSYIQVAHNSELRLSTTESNTIECWVYFSTAGDKTIFTQYNSTSANSDHWCGSYFTSGADPWEFKYWRYNSANSYTGLSSGKTLYTKRWYHLAIVNVGNSLKMYVDGKLKNTATYSGSPDASLTNPWRIGGHSGSDSMTTGMIDGFRIVRGVAVYTDEFEVPTTRPSATQSNQGTNIADISAYNSGVGTGVGTVLLLNSNKSGAITDHDDHINTSESIGVTTNFHTASGHYEYLLNGNYTSDSSNAVHWTTSTQQAISNAFFIISFGDVPQVVNKFDTIYQASNSSDYIVASEVTFSGSNDYSSESADTDWTSLVPDSGIASSGTSITNSFDWSISGEDSSRKSHQFTNTTAYKYYRIKIHGTPTIHYNPWWSGLVLYNTNDATDKATTISDSSGRSRSLTFNGSGAANLPRNSRGVGADKMVAPVHSFPLSGKLTGAAGFHFDGADGKYLTVNSWGGFGSGNFTFELWVYNEDRDDDTHNPMIFDGGNSSNGGGFTIQIEKTNGQILIYDRTQPATLIANSSSSYLKENVWVHIALVRSSGTVKLYLDGTEAGSASNSSNFNSNLMTLGRYRGGNDYNFHGYIDGVRASVGTARYTSNFTPPTRTYGAYGAINPDVGTITLTATGDGDFTWSEMSQGTALPGTLAVGSTTHSGSGNSRTHTATITGTLPANTSTTFTSGIKGDTATQGILLKVQHDTDATKAVTLNGTTGMGITNKSTDRPVLFNARRYHGTEEPRDITGLGFQPDLIWIKHRSNTSGTGNESHTVFDSLRTEGHRLSTDANSISGAAPYGKAKPIADGFELFDGTNGTYPDAWTNWASRGYISWCWKAGGKPSGTLGTINSGNPSGAGTISNTGNVTAITQSVDQNAGFSITKYTGGAGATNATSAIPHNLGGTPDFIIVKNLSGTYDWVVYHKDLTTDKNVNLNNDTIEGTKVRGYIDAPDSTNINLHASTDGTYYGRAVNRSGDDFICYAWKAVAGVSAFGTYSGQISSAPSSSSDPGWCGFKPRLVIGKRKNGNNNWWAFDRFRESGDALTQIIKPDDPDVEFTASNWTLTVTTNGFTTGNIHAIGESGGTYVFMAFA